MDSKPSATVHQVPEEEVRPGVQGQPARRASKVSSDIWIACAVITLPMVILSAILLGLVFHNEVDQSSIVSVQPPRDNRAAYLVNFSSTRLITVASWTSTVAPLLPVFVMTLLSFPAAQYVFKSSQQRQTTRLPTPYQLSLYVNLISGSLGSLWQWALYRSRKQRERQPPVIRTTVVGLVIALLIGYLILATDTWLHVTTSTVLATRVSVQPVGSKRSYGRGLYSSSCDTRYEYSNTPCTVDRSASSTFLMGASEAYQTLNNISAINRLAYHELNGESYCFLTEADIPRDTDFEASTFAIMTKCAPISQACNLEAVAGVSTPFFCSEDFHGDVSERSKVVLFEDEALQRNITYGSEDLNPWYLGTWAHVDTQGVLRGMASPTTQLRGDSEIVAPVHGGMSWVLGCTATAYNAKYSWVNGSVAEWNAVRANASVGGIMAAPTNEIFALSDLEIAAKVASFSTTAQELADKWANIYSRVALGLSSGVMSPRTNEAERVRSDLLVARVAKAPLFTLIGLNLLYAVLGIGLAAYAARLSHRAEANDVQARLTIAGLVSECFEGEKSHDAVKGVEDLFVEKDTPGLSSRIGMERVPGRGWKYVVL